MKTIVMFALLGTALASPAVAGPILTQIGSSYVGADSYASQDFTEASFDAYDINALEDFTLTGSTTLTQVQAGFTGYNGFTSFGAVTGYRFNIYSSIAKAGTSLTGDVASFTFTAAQANVQVGALAGTTTDALVSLALNTTLGAGTYWFGVEAINSYNANGQTSVFGNGPLGNAYQANPGGGFGSGTTFPIYETSGDPTTQVSLAYNLSGNPVNAGVPEPASWAMMISGFGLVGGALRRRQSVLATA